MPTMRTPIATNPCTKRVRSTPSWNATVAAWPTATAMNGAVLASRPYSLKRPRRHHVHAYRRARLRTERRVSFPRARDISRRMQLSTGETVLKGLFTPRLGEPHHYAYVVEGIEATVNHLVGQLGAGPFFSSSRTCRWKTCSRVASPQRSSTIPPWLGRKRADRADPSCQPGAPSASRRASPARGRVSSTSAMSCRRRRSPTCEPRWTSEA